MSLFDKEKDFVLRLINLVFIIWFIVTLIIFFDGTVNVLVKKPVLSYSAYSSKNCQIEDCIDKGEEDLCTVPVPGEETTEELKCKSIYNNYLYDIDSGNVRYKKQLIASLASNITVVATLYILNKKKKTKLK